MSIAPGPLSVTTGSRASSGASRAALAAADRCPDHLDPVGGARRGQPSALDRQVGAGGRERHPPPTTTVGDDDHSGRKVLRVPQPRGRPVLDDDALHVVPGGLAGAPPAVQAQPFAGVDQVPSASGRRAAPTPPTRASGTAMRAVVSTGLQTWRRPARTSTLGDEASDVGTGTATPTTVGWSRSPGSRSHGASSHGRGRSGCGEGHDHDGAAAHRTRTRGVPSDVPPPFGPRHSPDAAFSSTPVRVSRHC